MRRALPLSASLLVLASLAGGQVGVEFDADATFGNELLDRFEGPFRQSIHGEFNGDLREDVMVMSKDRPFWVTSPGIYRSLRKHPRVANDFAVLPGGGDEGKDAVVMVSRRDGLELWKYSEEAADIVLEAVGAPIWADALEVDVLDFDADGLWEVVGWQGGDQTRFLRLEEPRSGIEEIFDVDYDVDRMIPIEWDGAPGDGRELLVSTSEGVKVLDHDFTELASFPGPALGIEVLTEGARPTQRFVYVYDDLVLGRVMQVVAPEGTSEPPSFFLPNAEVVSMVAGDVDGDGFDDLVLSQRITRHLVLFTNQQTGGASPTFDWNVVLLFDPTSDGSGAQPAPTNESWPVFSDLDDDGDADVLYGVEHEKQLAFTRNPILDHTEDLPTVNDVDLTYVPRLATGQLTLKMGAPAGPGGPGPADEALEVVVWRQASSNAMANKYAIDHQLLPASSWPLEVDVQVDGLFGSPQMLHVEMRLVDLDVTGTVVVRAGASYSYAFTSNVDSLVYLQADPQVEPGSLIFTDVVTTNTLPTGTDQLFWEAVLHDNGDSAPLEQGAWIVPMPNVPCFQNGFPNKYGIPN